MKFRNDIFNVRRPRSSRRPLFFRVVALSTAFFAVASVGRAAVGDNESASLVEPPRNVLVVAPPIFENALQPWIEYRKSQGFDVSVLTLAAKKNDSTDFGIQMEPVATPEEIRVKIQDFATRRPLAAILLVGDGAPTLDAKYGWRDVVPAARLQPLVVQEFGSENHLATDSYYSDLDADGLPDVAIGRLPVETPEELSAVVAKIIRYETASPVGNWTRKINVVVGSNGLNLNVVGSSPEDAPTSGPSPLSGLSSFVDSFVDGVSKRLFAELLPQEFATTLTRCSLASEFCPYPPEFGRTFLDRANEGALFLVYLGHGRVFGLDRLQTSDGGDYGLFEIDDCSALNAPQTSPIALFFACYVGAYDASYRSLAEEVALSPNGPVAVLAASRRTAPYGMCVLGSELMNAAFDPTKSVAQTPQTLGEILLRAQRKTLEPPEYVKTPTVSEDEFQFDDATTIDEKNANADDSNGSELDAEITLLDKSATPIAGFNARLDRLNARLERELRKADERKTSRSLRQTLDRTAEIFDPTASRLHEQLEDHVALFNLFGDPLLRVKFPERVVVDAPEIAYSTKTIPISGEIPNFSGKKTFVQAELLLADFRSPVKKPRRLRTFVESDATRDDFQTTYRAANEFVVDAVCGSTTNNGRFSAEIVVPANFSGECVVRVAATDGERYFIGSKRVVVRPFTRRDAVEQAPEQRAD